ncbi:MAG: HEAT repeat domain-containing protein [Candidatus Freyarchaeota archaeon]|nr:HEAT repeat domain-containing protein [Candidatus Freyrarchaeum guaymaensis]
MKEKLFEEVGLLLHEGDELGALKILKELMNDEDPEVKVASLTVISVIMGKFRRIIEEAFPQVLRMALQDPHVYVRGNALELLGKVSFEFPEIVERHVHEVVSNLSLQDSDLAWNAVVALGWIGGSQPGLIAPFIDKIGAGLKSSFEINRITSAMALGWIGSIDAELVEKYIPQLLELSKPGEAEEVRLSAIDALASISHGNALKLEGAVEDLALISVIDENENIRGSAMEAIIEVCKEKSELARAVASVVLKNVSLEGGADWKIVVTLGLIGTGSPEAIPHMIPELLKALESRKVSVRATATLAIGWLIGNNPELPEEAAKTAINAVSSLLEDENPEVRRCAVESIGWISVNNPQISEEAVSIIEGVLLNERDERVKLKAEEVIEFMRERIKHFKRQSA